MLICILKVHIASRTFISVVEIYFYTFLLLFKDISTVFQNMFVRRTVISTEIYYQQNSKFEKCGKLDKKNTPTSADHQSNKNNNNSFIF